MHNQGVFLINKPTGITSFQVVAKLRRIINIKKIGHSGTLDPFASGLLQVAFGRATKILTYLNSSNKTYIAKLVFGQRTDTGDLDGEVIESEEVDFMKIKENLQSSIDAIIKVDSQVPPKYSAIKVNGKRAYKLAREKKVFEIPSRDMKVFAFEVLELSEKYVIYKATVSKGTYIRVLSETFANFLGTIGFTQELQRTEIEDFSIENAVDLADLTKENFHKYIHPIEEFLQDFPSIVLNDEQIEKYKHGMRINFESDNIERVFVTNQEKKGLGFASIENNILSPKTVFI